MISYLVRRSAYSVLVLMLLSLVVFFGFRAVPGSVIDRQLAEAGAVTPEKIAAMKHDLGLDRPLFEQLIDWYSGLLHGDFGQSLWTGDPVTAEIATALVPTLQLGLAALLIALTVGLFIGTVAALWKGRTIDGAVRTASASAEALPDFWLALLILVALAQTNFYMPIPYQDFTDNPTAHLQQILIPALALAVGPAAVISRITRSSMLDILNSDFVTASKARGVPVLGVYTRHALKNALIPVLTMLGILAIRVLGGTVIIESIFSIPGLGRLLFASVENRDYTLLQGIVVTLGLIVVIINLLVDVMYNVVDPRMRTATS